MGILEQIISHIVHYNLTNTPEKQTFFMMIAVMVLASWFLDYALRLFRSSPVQSSILFTVALGIGMVAMLYIAEGIAQQSVCLATVALFLIARRAKFKSIVQPASEKPSEAPSQYR